MYSRKQSVVIYLAMIASFVFAGVVAMLEMKQNPGLPIIATLPTFEVTDQDGHKVTQEDFKGRIWLASFVYTTCPGPCPIISAHMAELTHKLPLGVMLASFSTDPAHDTPEVLKAYAQKYNAPGNWYFLTSPPAKQYDLINHGFLMAATAPAGAPIIHSTQIALVDQSGNIRGYYDGTSEAIDPKLIADVKSLMDQ